MKTTFSKTFGGATNPSSCSKVARPGIKGLYGKKPDEKMRTAIGTRMLAIRVAQLPVATGIVFYVCGDRQVRAQDGSPEQGLDTSTFVTPYKMIYENPPPLLTLFKGCSFGGQSTMFT
jgi:hypothetical protein